MKSSMKNSLKSITITLSVMMALFSCAGSAFEKTASAQLETLPKTLPEALKVGITAKISSVPLLLTMLSLRETVLHFVLDLSS